MMPADADDIRRRHRLADIAGQHVKLIRDGREFKALCPFHADSKTPNFTIFQGRDGVERFECFACGAQGDVIDFVQEFNGVGFREAVEILDGKPATPAPRQRTPTLPPLEDRFMVLYPPRTAPRIVAGERTPAILNPKRSDKPTASYVPEAVYSYRDRSGRLVAHVLRVTFEDGKKITPAVVWAKERSTGDASWAHLPIPTPRPLYRLPELLAQEGQVLIVEGEKCADAAAAVLPIPVTAWASGAQAWPLTNLSPLKGRSVLIWPDNDDAGRAAMLGAWNHRRGEWKPGIIDKLLELGCSPIKVVRAPADKPKGWDVADAIAEGWDAADLKLFLKDHVDTWGPERLARYKEKTRPATPPQQPVRQLRVVEAAETAPDTEDQPAAPPLTVASGDNRSWMLRLVKDKHDNPVAKSKTNFRLFLENYSTLKGVFGWDAFAQTVRVVKCPPWEPHPNKFMPHKVDDADVIHCAGYLENMGLRPTKADAKDALLVASMAQAVNPVLDFFESLKWDGIERIRGDGDRQPWLSEYMGAVDSPINRAFGMRWLIAAVRRAYHPGVKMDTMLILEGAQGKLKSTALEVLGTLNGVSYYTASMLDFHSKDAMQALGGKLIVEIAEMSAMQRSDTAAVKKLLTIRVDEYRPPYGSTVQSFPRTSVFAGTINPREGGYLRDPTGGRRFWPVLVSDIDIARLREDQAQLWAEAVVLHKAGEQHWLTSEEETWATPEQKRRQEEHPWKERIAAYVAETLLKETRIADIFTLLSVPIERQTPQLAAVVSDILAELGFVRMTRRRDGRRPETYYLLTDDQPS